MLSFYARTNYTGMVGQWISQFPLKDQRTFIQLNDVHSIATVNISDILPIDEVNFNFNALKGKVEALSTYEFVHHYVDKNYSSIQELVIILSKITGYIKDVDLESSKC